MTSNANIAVIGMGCVYPGALSPETLWENILAGRRYFRITPDERLPNEYYFDPDPSVPGKTYCNRMAVIDGWTFDPTQWKIPPITYDQSEIVHWLALHTSHQALQNAGLDFSETDTRRVGVVLGNSGSGEFHRSYLMPNRWPFVERAIRRAIENNLPQQDADELVDAVKHYYNGPFPEIQEDYLAGIMGNVIAGRIANYYDFRSAAYTVDGACASSLLAIIQACRHLESGDMDVALCGGVDVSLDPLEMVGFAKTQALTKEDIRPYDAQADGIQTGEGCGIFVLTTEDYARQHNYAIRALIKGWGISADGSGGITQPKVEGQQYALEKAYQKAGYSISSIGYIEGHGTGTPVGDRVEITTLKGLMDADDCQDICHIGSLKANIGHTKAAAGAAGLMKAVFTLERKILPPHINLETPNPAFGSPLSNLRPCEGGPWLSDRPRRASVSAFGFGGANTHVTLEEVNHDVRPRESELKLIGSQQKSELLFLSAASNEALQKNIEQLSAVAERICQAELTDLSAALAKQQHRDRYRAAIVCTTPWQLSQQLNTLADGLKKGLSVAGLDNPQAGLYLSEAVSNPRLAVLFPGQGSQRLNMTQDLLKRFDFAKKLYQTFDDLMVQRTGQSIQQRVFHDLREADDQTRQDWEDALRNTLLQQPAIVASSLVILQVLAHFGLKPSFAAGHSLGEISALSAGGALEAGEAFQLAVLRAQAMHDLNVPEAGGMAAIGADPAALQSLLDQYDLKLVITNFNAPRQNVVSGPLQAIDRLLALCEQRAWWARKLPVSHAFHSTAVAQAADNLRKALQQIPMQAVQDAAVYSSSTGTRLHADDDLRELLASQVVRPVRWLDVIKQIDTERPDLWIEVGPGQVLSGLTQEILGADNFECFPTDLAHEEGLHSLNRLLARAFVGGFPVRTERLFEGRFHRPFDPYDYHPILIVNPCERPVKSLEKPLKLSQPSLPFELMPDTADHSSFSQYLASRGGFLKQYIDLDYQNWPGRSAASPPDSPPESTEPLDAPREELAGKATEPSMLDLVIDWIVARTGYPREFVTPEKKLRDDLNLDSIKAGELALMLSKQMNKDLPVDLGVVANASIEYLVNSVREFEGQRISMDDSLSNSWIKTFGIELLPAPLDLEERGGLPLDGTVCVIGQQGLDSRTEALAALLEKSAVGVQQLSLQQSLDGTMADDLSGLVLILQEQQQPFYEFNSAQFQESMEGLATSLFRLMQKVLPIMLQRDDFHLLVIRPRNATDAGCDVDGAAGFFKTLSLEYDKPGFNWKWLSLPGQWDPVSIAECAALELQTSGERIEYHYSDAGDRLSPGAVQTGETQQKAPRLGGLDTLLVTGGGKGITFEMAFALAGKIGVKLGLIGSSPVPQADQDDGELARNLQRLRGKGIRHLYLQADVTRQTAVQQAVRQIERSLGRISVILHGAGVSKFSGFQEMDLENYLSCLRVKTRGLYHLLSAVPPKRLKALHVISSVLGRTGMYRQADYTYANAWLDAATLAVTRNNPNLHGFSVGYSVWDGTGIGAKSGSMEMLQKIGVTPISIEQGVSSYLELVTSRYPFSTFVHTGRLNEKLEPRLMPGIRLPDWRFLENIRRFVPGVELIAEATLTHTKDRYLPEHVFAGTPLMPTVMGLEGMVQAAMACIGSEQLPVIQQFILKRPMIVAEASATKIRTLALCDPMVDGTRTVTVRMRSDSDGFATDHYEIRCIFGSLQTAPESIPMLPAIPEGADAMSPEAFAPSPLFQGRFLRRISRIFELRAGKEALTEITVPIAAKYYSDEFEQCTQTPAPAIRDAMLQSAALMAPPAYLPESIQELHFFRPLQEGEKLICHAQGIARDAQTLTTDILLYDQAGEPVEWMKGLVVKATSTLVDLEGKQRIKTQHPKRVEESLKCILTGNTLSLAIAYESDLLEKTAFQLLTNQDRDMLLNDIAKPRWKPRLVNLLATRKSALQYFKNSSSFELSPDQIRLDHSAGGKPRLLLSKQQHLADGLHISLADSHGISIALISQQQVGIDIELVEPRDSETWLALLGDDGYRLALSLQRETGESFDASTTRVWTLLEAGKKAYDLQRLLPRFNDIIDDSWMLLEGSEDPERQLLSTMIENHGREFVVSIATHESNKTIEEQQYG